MQVTGMLYGARMLRFVGYPTTEALDPGASEEEIRALIERAGMVFVKPVFKGGVGKKGKAGLIGRATDLSTEKRSACTSSSTGAVTRSPRPTESLLRPGCRPSMTSISRSPIQPASVPRR